MLELLPSNDPVVLSLAAALLADSDVAHHLADDHLSDSSIGDLQPRLLVSDDQAVLARRILTDAGILDKPLA